jgi:hypothetical protein
LPSKEESPIKTAFAILTTFLLLARRAPAQPAPAGPPPGFKVVSATGKTKGLIEFIEALTRTVPVQKWSPRRSS